MDPIVATTAGMIRGEPLPLPVPAGGESAIGAGDARSGYVFRGVPFAAAPVGSLRFRPPQPLQPWDGVRDCTRFGAVCPQPSVVEARYHPFSSGTEVTDEDCLLLNVWTPSLDDRRRKPVIVYLHGGGFAKGSGILRGYDGTHFAEDGVVFVTFNFRLHGLGFLYLDTLFDGMEGSGNHGLLDQIAALQWVRNNIAAFGGDPDRVTVFGSNSGASSIAALMASPLAHGLFRRAILQSGGAAPRHEPQVAERITRRVLDLLGVRPGDLAALQAVPVGRLVAVCQQMMFLEAPQWFPDEPIPRALFSPVVDGVVLPGAPQQRLTSGSAGIDLMLGTCEDELRLLYFGAPAEFSRRLPDPQVAAAYRAAGVSADEAFKVYAASWPEADRRDLAIRMAGDLLITLPSMRLAEAQLRHGRHVWMYRFVWRTPVAQGTLRACSMLDVPFVFGNLDDTLLGPQPPAQLARDMRTAWIRFATFGDPSGGRLPRWPQYEPERRATMFFDERSRVVADPDAEKRHLWDAM